MPRLLIAASGTGGHIFPALALADSLSEEWEVQWMGVPDRLEKELVPDKYELFTFKVGGLQGKPWRKLFELCRLFWNAFAVGFFLRKQEIDAVFTTGGYIAAPAILGAKISGIPIVIHESNAIPGRVTRLLGRLCDYVAIGLPPASKYLPNCKKIFTGTPVRKEFFFAQDLPEWVPSGKGPLVVVMGGSQGAMRLNQMVRNISPLLIENGCRIIHLIGDNDSFDKSKKVINHPNLIEKTFSNEIPGLLQNADIVISRAGASAISELSVSGAPAILVPYPQATDQHQELNAAYAAEFGAAIIVHQHEPNDFILKDTVMNLLGPKLSKQENQIDCLLLMKENMKRLQNLNPEEELKLLLNSII